MQTSELAEPGIGALGPHPGRDEGITGEKEVDHRPELDHLIRVACRLGMAVLSPVLPVLGLGDRVPRVGGSVVGKPGIARVFPHLVVIKGFNAFAVEMSARHQEAVVVGSWIAATTQQVATAQAQLL